MDSEITFDQSSLISRHCPRHGQTLVRYYDEDLECWCWKCPDPTCEYFEIEE